MSVSKETLEQDFNKRMKTAARVALTMKGAFRQYKEEGWDVAEVYSQPRIAQEAGLRKYGGTRLTPGWCLAVALLL